MTEQEKYMKAALKLAHKAAEEGEVPVGAVVVCDGKIVGRGRNRRETKKNALHHAEIEAIEKACRKLGGWRLHRCDQERLQYWQERPACLQLQVLRRICSFRSLCDR